MEDGDVRFFADTMLGRLAKWLRIMGFDTHYQPYFDEMIANRIIEAGFIFISRQRQRTRNYKNSIYISSDTVRGQLQELKKGEYIPSYRSKWFKRCLICNVILSEVQDVETSENIPEYILYQNKTGIYMCPSCNRYFWPGSHRNRMINQLKTWGIIVD